MPKQGYVYCLSNEKVKDHALKIEKVESDIEKVKDALKNFHFGRMQAHDTELCYLIETKDIDKFEEELIAELEHKGRKVDNDGFVMLGNNGYKKAEAENDQLVQKVAKSSESVTHLYTDCEINKMMKGPNDVSSAETTSRGRGKTKESRSKPEGGAEEKGGGRLDALGIRPGKELVYKGTTVIVARNDKVKLYGEVMSLSAVAGKISADAGGTSSVNGWDVFEYKGKKLSELEDRVKRGERRSRGVSSAETTSRGRGKTKESRSKPEGGAEEKGGGRLDALGIRPGKELVYKGTTVIVARNDKVKLYGEVMSLSAVAGKISADAGGTSSVNGWDVFEYKGKKLSELEDRVKRGES